MLVLPCEEGMGGHGQGFCAHPPEQAVTSGHDGRYGVSPHSLFCEMFTFTWYILWGRVLFILFIFWIILQRPSPRVAIKEFFPIFV